MPPSIQPNTVFTLLPQCYLITHYLWRRAQLLSHVFLFNFDLPMTHISNSYRFYTVIQLTNDFPLQKHCPPCPVYLSYNQDFSKYFVQILTSLTHPKENSSPLIVQHGRNNRLIPCHKFLERGKISFFSPLSRKRRKTDTSLFLLFESRSHAWLQQLWVSKKMKLFLISPST